MDVVILPVTKRIWAPNGMYSGSRHTQYEENQFARFGIDSRILFLDLRPGVRLDLSAAKLIVADRIRIQEGKTFPVLAISGGHSTTKAARDYLSGFGSELVKAIAFIKRPAFQPNSLTFYLPQHLSLEEICGRKNQKPLQKIKTIF